MDQASTLRTMAELALESPAKELQSQGVRVIAVTSGKGGVGKTNVVANLGLALQRMNRRVGILDADLGLANMDILLGLKARYNIHHLLRGERPLAEVLVKGPGGVTILPAGSGVAALTGLEEDQWRIVYREMAQMGRGLDVLLIDTAAGISGNVVHFLRVAEEVILVVSPEPTSIVDAYAVMKVMSLEYGVREFRLLVNLVRSAEEARDVFHQLCRVSDQFLQIDIIFQGFVYRDEWVGKAVRRHQAVLEAFPRARASRSFEEVARRLLTRGRL
ncbi:MAG: MinD/ParA family protein [Candidatus Tectomicrobia bacterium]|nr:MinD/ParA family protein [Candidatus Tectomicrobia bacterium]